MSTTVEKEGGGGGGGEVKSVSTEPTGQGHPESELKMSRKKRRTLKKRIKEKEKRSMWNCYSLGRKKGLKSP